jgi:arylamine N-acetyltransferase
MEECLFAGDPVHIFNKVRDIEYHVTEKDLLRPEKGFRNIIGGNGYCVNKHYLLGEGLRQLGYDVCYVSGTFMWAEQDYIKNTGLREIAGKLPLTRHLYCRVTIGGERVLLDATWDSALEKAGFPVNRWDGRSDTAPAVKMSEEKIYYDITSHAESHRMAMKEYCPKEKKALADFSRLFNDMLCDIRKKRRRV